MENTERGRVEVGYRTGNLTVVSKTDERKNGYTVWLCRCSCGGTIRLDTRALQRGTVSDCGCVTKVRPGQKDLSGQRFGRLVALEPTGERSAKGTTVWRCRCDCGKETLAEVTQLLHGAKRSCGCLRARTVMENMQFIGGMSVTRLEKNRNRLSRTNSAATTACTITPGRKSGSPRSRSKAGRITSAPFISWKTPWTCGERQKPRFSGISSAGTTAFTRRKSKFKADKYE